MQYSFDILKNKFNYYRGKDCMNHICKDLKEHVTRITNYEKKKFYHKQLKKVHHMINRIFVTYEKKNLVLMIKNTIKSEIIVTTLENGSCSKGELLIIFAIRGKKHQKKFLKYFIMVLHTTIIS